MSIVLSDVAALASRSGAGVLGAHRVAGWVAADDGLGIDHALVRRGGLVAKQGAIAQIAVFLRRAIAVFGARAGIGTADTRPGSTHIASRARVAIIARASVVGVGAAALGRAAVGGARIAVVAHHFGVDLLANATASATDIARGALIAIGARVAVRGVGAASLRRACI